MALTTVKWYLIGYGGIETVNVLAIGPHPDDIELGCFGTLTKLAKQKYAINILLCSNGECGGNLEKRLEEVRESAKLINAKIHFGNLPDTKISEGTETIKIIEDCIQAINPDIIFVNSEKDTHQDHRNVAKATVSATRFGPDEVYIYESPSTTRNFMPILYYDITEEFDTKIAAVRIHTSQGKKAYMADRAIKGLAEYRAFEIGKNDRLAEGFEILRILKK